jgi:hypothetical protein
MTITISRESGSARRSYRIECPDDARFYTDPADSHETILIPGPEHRQHPERSVWLRLDDAIHAAREGRYGLRLVAEEELPRANAAEVASVRVRRPDAEDCAMNRRRFLALGAIGLAGLTAGTPPVVASGTDDTRFPATIVAEVGGKPVRLALTGTALRTKLRVRVYAVASYAPEGIVIPSPEALAALDAPKLLHLIFERDVDGATLAKAYRESIGRSYPAPAFAAELSLLERHFVANPVQKGDHVRLTHVPGVGMGVQVNDRPGMVVGGVGFAQAAWGTYLGPNHLGVALKEGLTSRMR